jgi:hypothetical protein
MTAAKALTDNERQQLLRDLATLKSDDDDAVAQDPKWFLPLEAHARALRPETLVVRGGRGAGKTALFHFLGHAKKRPELIGQIGQGALSSAIWLEGFSSASDHPPPDVVGNYGKSASADECRLFWFAWLCARVSSTTGVALPPTLRSLLRDRSPTSLEQIARAQLALLSSWLDETDRSRVSPVIVTYDHLDRLQSHSSSASPKLASSLLAMWLALSDRYRSIRPKIFIREDLFQNSLSDFPDASKLDARSVSIEWRVEDLYRVLVKHMANSSEDLRRWIQSSTKGLSLRSEQALGWMPPDTLPETGKESQKSFVDHVAGEQMGSGERKGLTYRWIPNHLQDAHTRVVPRSILSLFRYAAEAALAQGPKAKSLRLLHPLELHAALIKTSQRRVGEIKEEFPVVQRLENLRDKSVMMDRKVAIAALSRKAPGGDDEFGGDGEAVLRTLMDLGVTSEWDADRINIPDIYRYGFGISRKGGVKRPR